MSIINEMRALAEEQFFALAPYDLDRNIQHNITKMLVKSNLEGKSQVYRDRIDIENIFLNSRKEKRDNSDFSKGAIIMSKHNIETYKNYIKGIENKLEILNLI